MQMAITAYKSQQIKSKRRAAAVFEVSETTLQACLNGRKPCNEIHPNNHKLTDIEEKILIKQLLDAGKRGFTIRPEFLHEMAQMLLHNHTKDPTATLGVNWASIFIK